MAPGWRGPGSIREHPGWSTLILSSGKAVKQVLLKVLPSLMKDEKVPGTNHAGAA